MRNRRSVWAFAISCLGAVVGLGYQIFIAKMPASMKAGGMGLLPWAIILITILPAVVRLEPGEEGRAALS